MNRFLVSSKTWLVLLFICCFPASSFAGIGPDLRDVFFQIGESEGIDPYLLLAIAKRESNYHEYALNCGGHSYFPESRAGAIHILRREGLKCDIGLMQINYTWNGERLGKSVYDLLSPAENIRAAVKILRQNMSGTDNSWVAVGRYHNWANKIRSSRYARIVYRYYLGLRYGK